jgi:hypothetical protein
MPLIIVIVYGIMTALTLLAVAGIVKFRSLPSESFGNLRYNKYIYIYIYKYLIEYLMI